MQLPPHTDARLVPGLGITAMLAAKLLKKIGVNEKQLQLTRAATRSATKNKPIQEKVREP